jgi:hypothetical protein
MGRSEMVVYTGKCRFFTWTWRVKLQGWNEDYADGADFLGFL